jgi:hypothetical protein
MRRLTTFERVSCHPGRLADRLWLRPRRWPPEMTHAPGNRLRNCYSLLIFKLIESILDDVSPKTNVDQPVMQIIDQHFEIRGIVGQQLNFIVEFGRRSRSHIDRIDRIDNFVYSGVENDRLTP